MPPISTASWLRAFLTRRGLDTPDNRPLFEYRVTLEELAQLREYLARRFPTTTHDTAAFCLYAAEWWRRHGKGFRWEGLLESLELPVPYTDLYEPIERGITFWGRELRIGRATQGTDRQWRDFVGTLSREGGLPLQMLLGAQNSVRRFFRNLLKERYASGEMSANKAEAVGRVLPNAWRHPDIFSLAARLVTRLWELRESVKDSDHPVDELDRLQPNWKDSLPVLIDNDIAATLVRGLVADAHEIAVARRPVLVVDTRLIRRGDRWLLERHIDPPRKIRADRMSTLLGLGPDVQVPNRLRFVLDEGGQRRLLAVVTQWETTEPYGVELLTSAPIRIQTTREIALLGETREQRFGGNLLRGGDALESVPWIFIDDGAEDDSEEWKLIGQGSARLRSTTTMLVAVPEDWQVIAPQMSNTILHGRLTAIDGTRVLIAISKGSVTFTSPDADVYRVEVDAAKEELWSYRLEGESFGEYVNVTLWHGVPTLVAEAASGLRRVVGRSALEWRPWGIGASWRSMSDQCIGRIELRYSADGVTHFRKAIQVAPPAMLVEMTPRTHPNAGGLRLAGLGTASAEVVTAGSFQVTRCDCSEGYEWTFETLSDPPATVSIELSWPDDRSLRLRLPYPVAGIRFVDRAGRVLPADATLALENLSGSHVEAIVPRSEPPPVIVAQLKKARDRSSAFSRDLECWHPLRDQDPRKRSILRRYRLDLSEVEEDIRLRLASSSAMNAHVSLSVRSRTAGQSEIHVRRFPVALWVDREADAIVVLEEKSEMFLDSTLETMNLTRIPIVSPSGERVPMARLTGTSWALGDLSDAEEAWLVVGSQNDRCCARPVIFAPSGAGLGEPPEEPVYVNTLDAAVKIPRSRTRQNAFKDMLTRMVLDPTNPEWPHLNPYIHTLDELPATTFDLLDAMAAVPASCVYALLAGQPRLSFHTLWSAFEDLSFAWEMVSVSDWVRGVRIWWESNLRSIEGVADAHKSVVTESIFATYPDTVDQISIRMRGFSIIRELVERHVFSKSEDAGQSLTRMVSFPGGVGRAPLLEDRNRALQDLRRRHANDQWPVLDATRVLNRHLTTELPPELTTLLRFATMLNADQLSVALAPALSALSVACGISLRPTQIFAIRQLKAFDLNWFQRCYETTLAVAVGLLLENDPERYR